MFNKVFKNPTYYGNILGQLWYDYRVHQKNDPPAFFANIFDKIKNF